MRQEERVVRATVFQDLGGHPPPSQNLGGNPPPPQNVGGYPALIQNIGGHPSITPLKGVCR